VIVLSILPSMPDFIERLRSPKNLFDKTHPHAVICCMIYSDTWIANITINSKK